MKKVLIVSGTPMRNDTNLGKTLQTLFSSCDSSRLAQLYFSIEKPNIDACGSYWQVFEFQLLKSGLGLLAGRCGKEVTPDTAGTRPDKMPDSLTKNRTGTFTLVGREWLWRLSHWKNRRLKAWLDREQPEHIFAVLSDSGERADSIRWLARRTGCPVTLFVTDDYYHDETGSRSLIRRWFFWDKQRRIRRMARCCDRVVGCSEVAAQEFGELLDRPGEAIYTPSREDFLRLPFREQSSSRCVMFRYFGNIGLERWRSLKQLGETIRDINTSLGRRAAFLEVYSLFTDESVTGELAIEDGAAFMGFVSGDRFTQLLQEADVAVHVESFLPAMIRRTRLSVSTKIADYLGCGKCILAIGPAEVASMQHLQGVSCQVTDPACLRQAVEELLASAEERQSLQEQARAFALTAHSRESIAGRVRSLFEE